MTDTFSTIDVAVRLDVLSVRMKDVLHALLDKVTEQAIRHVILATLDTISTSVRLRISELMNLRAPHVTKAIR